MKKKSRPKETPRTQLKQLGKSIIARRRRHRQPGVQARQDGTQMLQHRHSPQEQAPMTTTCKERATANTISNLHMASINRRILDTPRTRLPMSPRTEIKGGTATLPIRTPTVRTADETDLDKVRDPHLPQSTGLIWQLTRRQREDNYHMLAAAMDHVPDPLVKPS